MVSKIRNIYVMAAEVISEDFHKVAFTVGEHSNAEDREMIVVDAVNPGA